MAGGICQNSCSFFIHASQNCMLHDPPDTTVPIYPGLGLELGVQWLVVPHGEGYPLSLRYTNKGSFESLFDLSCMSLGSWRKQEHLEENPCEHREESIKPQIFHCEVSALTTAPQFHFQPCF